jgi:hypothetical protein
VHFYKSLIYVCFDDFDYYYTYDFFSCFQQSVVTQEEMVVTTVADVVTIAGTAVAAAVVVVEATAILIEVVAMVGGSYLSLSNVFFAIV